MKNILTILLFSLLTQISYGRVFPETWAYLMKGEESYFPTQSPITDVACFSAVVDENGNLKGGHLNPPARPGTYEGTRYHLVITLPWNNTLAHIYLDKALPFRSRIIKDIVA